MAKIICSLCLADITDISQQSEIEDEHSIPMLVCLKCAAAQKKATENETKG